MKFAKLHGQGNDFLVAPVTAMERPAAGYAPLARAMCERHYGVGADGLILVRRSETDEADFAVRIFNADGGEAEVSGNGIRCVAAYVHHQKLSDKPTLDIRTVAGVKALRLLENRGRQYRFESDMGPPTLAPEQIPVRIAARLDRVIQYPLPVGGEQIPVTVTSMGNPHCAVFCEELDETRVNQIGPQIESHAVFPRRTNVEFIQVRDRRTIAVRFWERGVGRTLSSGTGSSSAAVASILNDFTDERVTVQTLAGPLEIEWRGRDRVFLTGPAEFIFAGEYETDII